MGIIALEQMSLVINKQMLTETSHVFCGSGMIAHDDGSRLVQCEYASSQFEPGLSNLLCFAQEPSELAQTQPLSACKVQAFHHSQPETLCLSIGYASAPYPSIF